MKDCIYVVSYNCVPDYDNVLVTTELKGAVDKKIESNSFEIGIWFDGVEIGIYGDRTRHNQTNYEKVYEGVLEIINNYLDKT